YSRRSLVHCAACRRGRAPRWFSAALWRRTRALAIRVAAADRPERSAAQRPAKLSGPPLDHRRRGPDRECCARARSATRRRGAFEVVFVDPAMVVVNKPAGVVVHPAPGNKRGTLVNGLLARFPELRAADGDLRPGIVHRLDKDTSGLLVVGRTLAATAALQRQMQSRSPEKRYLMLVRGNIGEDEGLIDAPIARDLRMRP